MVPNITTSPTIPGAQGLNLLVGQSLEDGNGPQDVFNPVSRVGFWPFLVFMIFNPQVFETPLDCGWRQFHPGATPHTSTSSGSLA